MDVNHKNKIKGHLGLFFVFTIMVFMLITLHTLINKTSFGISEKILSSIGMALAVVAACWVIGGR